jgi:hypothetical protein
MQFTFINMEAGDQESKVSSHLKVDKSRADRVAEKSLFSSPQHEAATSKLTALKKMYLETYLKTGSPTATAKEMGGVSPKHVGKEMKRIAAKLGFKDAREMRVASIYRDVKRVQEESASASDLMAILESQGYRCALTGGPLVPANARLDHIVPLSSDGTNSPDNLQWVTEEINTAKGTMSQEAFIRMCVAVAKHAGKLIDFRSN